MALDNSSWLDAAATYLREHGPTRLSALGGAIRRRHLTTRLSTLVGGDPRFLLDSKQLVSLCITADGDSEEQAECQTDAIWLDVAATYVCEFGPATLSTLGSEIRRRPSPTQLSKLIRDDARFSLSSAQLVSLRESQAVVDVAWLDAAAAYIAAHGSTTVTVLGGAIPRSVRGTKLSNLIRGDSRFSVDSALLVSLRSSRTTRSNNAYSTLDINIHSPQVRERMEKNKGGIEIDKPIIFAPCAVGQAMRTPVRIVNTSSPSRSFPKITVLQTGSEFSIESPQRCEASDEGWVLTVTVTYTPQQYGVSNALLAFHFDRMSFSIGRFISASCDDNRMREHTVPSAPYEPVRPRRTRRHNNAVEGVRPNGGNGGAVSDSSRKMSGYDMPKKWRHETAESLKAVLKGLKSAFQAAIPNGPRLSLLDRYRTYYESLLWNEEVKLEMNMQIYSLSRAALDKRGTCLRLAVPGLAEKRPSLLRGDAVLATDAAAKNGVTYKGYIHVVEQDHVLLMFDAKFHTQHTEGRRYSIEFVYPRRTLRIIHQGLTLAVSAEGSDRAEFLASILFPAQRGISNKNDDSVLAGLAGSLCLESPEDIMAFTNRRLNTEQKLAVKRIVRRSRESASHLGSSAVVAPYVIFGPPGTGKTVTVVEAALQLLKAGDNHTRLLLCAPSNTAADLLVSRLAAAGVGTTDMFRVMSFMRNQNEVSDDVKKYCCYDPKFPGGYTLPHLAQLLDKRVIVSTCIMAGKLYNHGLPRDYFDVVMIDEAGHCWEAEIVACFAWLLKVRTGLLVLAGDPKQLGPVTYSDSKPVSVPDPDFETHDDEGDMQGGDALAVVPTPPGAPVVEGLGLSMLERLLTTDELYLRNTDLYSATGSYNSTVVTKLVNCYRCHPAIIHVANQQFYDGDLRDFAGPESHSLCAWPDLVAPKFPLIFHGINGENEREGNSPSWFNQAEIFQVFDYVQKLLATTPVLPSEIGIIAPYHKQVKKIKKVLTSNGLGEITVGSCEQFQGQERKVMIISTVRTAKDLIGYDAIYNLGFVANPKRLNVAVTRAKALLIVVGSPAVLWSDVHWRSLLEHCISNGGYTGVPPPDLTPDDTLSNYGTCEGDDDGDNIDGGFDEEYLGIDGRDAVHDDGGESVNESGGMVDLSVDCNELPTAPKKKKRNFIRSILKKVSRAFF